MILKYFKPSRLELNSSKSKRVILFNRIASLNPTRLKKTPTTLDVAAILNQAGYIKKDKFIHQGLGKKIEEDLPNLNSRFRGLSIRNVERRKNKPTVTRLEIAINK